MVEQLQDLPRTDSREPEMGARKGSTGLDKASNTWSERNSVRNVGEDRFEEYCNGRGLKFWRMGFDEKQSPVSSFWKVHPLVRSLPDYLVDRNGKLFWVHVKGTPCLKVDDLLLYSQFERDLSADCDFYIAFCFEGAPIFKQLPQVRELMTGLRIQAWSDGKQYMRLPL